MKNFDIPPKLVFSNALCTHENNQSVANPHWISRNPHRLSSTIEIVPKVLPSMVIVHNASCCTVTHCILGNFSCFFVIC